MAEPIQMDRRRPPSRWAALARCFTWGRLLHLGWVWTMGWAVLRAAWPTPSTLPLWDLINAQSAQIRFAVGLTQSLAMMFTLDAAAAWLQDLRKAYRAEKREADDRWRARDRNNVYDLQTPPRRSP